MSALERHIALGKRHDLQPFELIFNPLGVWLFLKLNDWGVFHSAWHKRESRRAYLRRRWLSWRGGLVVSAHVSNAETRRQKLLAKAGSMLAAVAKIKPQVSAGAYQGFMTCPHCNTGTLRWCVVGKRKHMRAKCTTSGCLEFIE